MRLANPLPASSVRTPSRTRERERGSSGESPCGRRSGSAQAAGRPRGSAQAAELLGSHFQDQPAAGSASVHLAPSVPVTPGAEPGPLPQVRIGEPQRALQPRPASVGCPTVHRGITWGRQSTASVHGPLSPVGTSAVQAAPGRRGVHQGRAPGPGSFRRREQGSSCMLTARAGHCGLHAGTECARPQARVGDWGRSRLSGFPQAQGESP